MKLVKAFKLQFIYKKKLKIIFFPALYNNNKMEEISEIGPASEADAPSGILCNTMNNNSISNSISNSINNSTKERKKLYRYNKNIVEEDALYEQGFNDGCRPSIDKKKKWISQLN